jgi:hypothetical protein
VDLTARIWNRGYARAALVGAERTMNPTPAAAAILKKSLGKKAYKRARARARRRKSFHKGNPLPAAIGVLSGLGGLASKLGGRFRAPSEKRAAALAPALVAAANAGNLTAAAGLIERAARPMIAKEHLVWAAAAAQLAPSIIAAVKAHAKNIPAADQSNPEAFAASVQASPYMAGGAAAGAPGPLGQYGQLLTPGVVTSVARAVGSSSRRRSSRQRYPTYVDRYGRQRYSSKPPGSQLRLPAGASIAEGTPYNFFTGAIGKGGAGTTAAQVGIAAVAGAAAYFGTQAVLKYFGGRALKKEEAGVAAALAAREARQHYALAHNLRGAPPTYGVPASVIREIGAGMKAKLAELGYDEHGVRVRSSSERFLSDYAPED